MLNEITSIQTKQAPISNQETARPGSPKKPTGEQFNDILGREVAEKTLQSKSDNNAKPETTVVSENKAPNSEETVQNNELAHQADKNTIIPPTHINLNIAAETQFSDTPIIPLVSPENSASPHVTPQPQATSALTQPTNQSGHAPTLQISPQNHAGPNAISQLQAISVLTQPHSQSGHTSTPPTSLGNNTGGHVTATSQFQATQFQTASEPIQSSNQPGQTNQPDLNSVIPGKNPAGDMVITPYLLNKANLGNNQNSATTPLLYQQDFHLENRLHTRSSQNLWQPLQTANFADNGNLLPFSADVVKEWVVKHNESVTLTHADHDTTFQLSTHSPTKILSQSAGAQTAAPLPISLDAQFGQPKWNHEFAQKIVMFAHQHHQTAELRLNPAHLGPVEIMLSMSNDNGTQASAQFVSPHLAVRDAIEAALPRLRELMAENGIQLGNVMVGAESSQQHERHEQHPSGHLANDTQSLKTQGYDDSRTERTIQIRKHSGIINTYA